MNPIRAFIRWNRSVCKRIESCLPQAAASIETQYLNAVEKYMNARGNQVIVDVGGGRSCRFAARRDPSLQNRIVCVDVSGDEMQFNRDVDEKRVCDIMQDLPFEAESVDLLVSRSVLEHLEQQDRFLANSYRVLKPGGVCVHLFPSKYALFALINQMLPAKISRWLVNSVFEGTKGILGFPAIYDKTYDTAFRSALAAAGLSVEEIQNGYYQSSYFSFFVPFFLISAFYEMCVMRLGIRNLCAYLLVIARKEEST